MQSQSMIINQADLQEYMQRTPGYTIARNLNIVVKILLTKYRGNEVAVDRRFF